MTNPIAADIQSLNPGNLVTLFELDTTHHPDGDLFRFHAGVNGVYQPIHWQGNEYVPLPMEAEGFEWNGQGGLPRPTFRVANVSGLMGAAVRAMDDLVGCRVTRIRTFFKYMDGVNYPSGTNPDEDWDAEFPRDTFYVNRKVSENKLMIEFELASGMDVEGVKIPLRQVVANVCPWIYRSPECGYTGGPVADELDNPTDDPNKDRCSHTQTGCEFRFNRKRGLPFGGFPGAGLIRQ